MRVQPAPAWDSGNSSALEEYADAVSVVANSLILLVTSAVGIAANIFVILAVYHQKSLQTCNNALVVNLAVGDILRCMIDCPVLLTIIIRVFQRGRVNKLICDTQVVSFSFSCCIQLMTLACISAERYQAIAQPFKKAQRRRRIMVLIPGIWTLAIIVAGLCLIYLKDSPVHVRCRGLQEGTSSSYDTFGLYMLFPVWAVCFGVITGFYARIFILVRGHNRKIFDKGTFLPKKDNAEDRQINGDAAGEKSEQNQTLSGSVLAELVTQGERNSSAHDAKKESPAAPLTPTRAPQCVSIGSDSKAEFRKTLEITDLETEQPCPSTTQVAAQNEERVFESEQFNPSAKKVEAKLSNGDAAACVKSSTTKSQKVPSGFDTDLQSKGRAKIDKTPSEIKESSPHVPSSALSEKTESTAFPPTEPNRAKSVATAYEGSSLPPVLANVVETEAAKQSVEVQGPVCMMPTKERRERASKNKESKMAKRAGYIIISFLLFWLPLITTILANFIAHKNRNAQVSGCVRFIRQFF